MDIRSQTPLACLKTAVVAALLLLGSLAHSDDDVLVIEGTQIRGDQELPTVMYIVPWQPPVAEELAPVQGGLAAPQVLEPLERYNFQRLVAYHRKFREARLEAHQKDREAPEEGSK
ncbi:hypothetical protein QQM79_02060 [Marinobacteraceae bacterium S3BR75-40.1]